MEVRELRVGNLVKYIYSEVDFSIISGLTYEVPHLDEITGCEPLYDELQLIPITEEWLLKFGFKKYDYPFTFYKLMDFNIESDDCGGYYFKINKTHNVYIESIHQLQNLYFALTQNELEIK